MKILSKLTAFCVAASFVCTSVQAGGEYDNLVKKVLPNTTYKNVFPVEFPNTLAVLLESDEIIYIYVPKEIIFIGEFYTKDGQSLTQLHAEKAGAKNTEIDISPLQDIALKIQDSNSSKYGFIVFTDPDCPFCKDQELYLQKKNIEVYNILTPIDQLHPKAREKSIAIVMEKLKIDKEKATTMIKNGETVASGLGLQGTPQTIVYERDSKKPVDAIQGFNKEKFEKYSKDEK